MAKFGIQKGDKIIIRAAAVRQEGTGQIVFIPDPIETPYEVTKVWNHGARCKGWGYAHNNCIISKYESPND